MAAGRKIAPKGAGKRSGGGAGNARVRVKSVPALPGRQRTVSSTQRRYQEAMAKVRAKGKRGGWHSIAEYKSASGAAMVRRDILAGRRLIDGKVADWDIETRRIHDGNGKAIGSELFVKLR